MFLLGKASPTSASPELRDLSVSEPAEGMLSPAVTPLQSLELDPCTILPFGRLVKFHPSYVLSLWPT